MREVLPGVWDWEAVHESLGFAVHAHAVDGTLVDPMVPESGIDELPFTPERIVLSNRHHDRHAQRFVEKYGLGVSCHRDGLHEFADRPLEAQPYAHGEEVAPGMRAYNVLESWPDECALHVEERGLLIVADAVIRDDGEELSFVPDQYLGDDPAEEKAHLREGLRGLLDLEFDHMLFGHGPPLIGGARDALRTFLQA